VHIEPLQLVAILVDGQHWSILKKWANRRAASGQ
jgi:hypothetical protein